MAGSTTKTRHTVKTPLSKDDYLEAATGRQPGFERTIDGVDANIGTNVQSRDRERSEDNPFDGLAVDAPLNETPGQVFETWQLPDPQAAIDAGLPPVVIPEHLITEDEDHPQGAEPLDRLNREHREALGNPRLNSSGYTVVDGASDDDEEVVVNPDRSGGTGEDENPPSGSASSSTDSDAADKTHDSPSSKASSHRAGGKGSDRGADS